MADVVSRHCKGVCMNNMKVNSKAKKFVLLLVVAVLSMGFIFASPLKMAKSAGNAKVYDEQFKAVAEPQYLDEYWVVRTFDNEVLLTGDGIELKIGTYSLVRLINLTDAPQVYLLDGYLTLSSRDSDIIVKTPVSVYSATKGTTLLVTSTDKVEDAYVTNGTVLATNTITGLKTDILAGAYVNVTFNGFAVQNPTENAIANVQLPKESEEITQNISESEIENEVEVKDATVTETPVIETPVIETPVVSEPVETEQVESVTPVEIVETVETPQVPNAPSIKESETSVVYKNNPLLKTFSYKGYEATLEAYVGKAYVKYPSFVTSQEVYTAAEAALNAYPKDLENVTIEVVSDGLAKLTYPETYGEKEFNYAVKLLEKELPLYIDSLLVQPEEVKIPKAPSEPSVYVSTVQNVPEAPVTPVSVSVSVSDVVAVPVSPVIDATPSISIIEISSTVDEAENETVKVPAIPSTPEIKASEIHVNVENTEIIETQEAVENLEEPVETATEEVSTKEEKKVSNIRFGAKISVSYGMKYGSKSTYKGLVSSDTFNLGFFMGNVYIAVDPYIAVGNFTFGLHLAVNTADCNATDWKNIFKFDKENGITGYISSIVRYIGRINYKDENSSIKIDVDRTHDVEFSSPVFIGYDRDFESNSRLTASFDGQFGFFGINLFMDDLELANKLDGKNQFAGLRLSAAAGPVEFGLSTAANIQNLDFLNKQYGVEFFPALDISGAFEIKGISINATLGGASKLVIGEVLDFKSLPYLVKLNAKLSTERYYIGLGAAYNKGKHLSNTVGTSVATVVTPFAGASIDANLVLGLTWGPVTIDSSATVPFALNKENGKILAYNTVKTRSDTTEEISADTYVLKTQVSFGGFSLDGGILIDGFSSKIANMANALIKKGDTKAAFGSLFNPDHASCFIGMSFAIAGFEAHIRGNYQAIDTTSNALVLSAGGSFSF